MLRYPYQMPFFDIIITVQVLAWEKVSAPVDVGDALSKYVHTKNARSSGQLILPRPGLSSSAKHCYRREREPIIEKNFNGRQSYRVSVVLLMPIAVTKYY